MSVVVASRLAKLHYLRVFGLWAGLSFCLLFFGERGGIVSRHACLDECPTRVSQLHPYPTNCLRTSTPQKKTNLPQKGNIGIGVLVFGGS